MMLEIPNTDRTPGETDPGPGSSVRERRRAQTTAEILEAAWDLCDERGLAGLSLRDLAGRVGMRAPSLYSYFDSKNAIYDAMFRQAFEQMAATMVTEIVDAPFDLDLFKHGALAFFDFCTENPVRYQLLFQRTIPGFEPSEESYALALEQLRTAKEGLAAIGITASEHVDLWTALLTGLTDQQISNDPGGDRWRRILDEAVDMFLDHVGAVPSATSVPSTRKATKT